MTEGQHVAISNEPPYSRWAFRFALALYYLSGLWGALQVASPDNGTLHIACVLLFAVCATLWARCDSLAHGRAVLSVLQMMYFCVWPIGALLYATVGYGWRGFFKVLVHGVAMLLVMCIAFFATLYGLHFAGLLDARYYPSN